MNGKEFSRWMDETGISMSEAAILFGVSEQTLYNWRSTIGVPARKLEWVIGQMAAHEQKVAKAQSMDRLVLEVTDQQLRSYIEAAAHEGIYFKDWAVKTLDKAAESDGDDGSADQTGYGAPLNPVEFPRAAEDGGPGYSAKNRDAG